MSKQILCRFYPLGTCRRGDKCKFLHPEKVPVPSLSCSVCKEPFDASCPDGKRERKWNAPHEQIVYHGCGSVTVKFTGDSGRDDMISIDHICKACASKCIHCDPTAQRHCGFTPMCGLYCNSDGYRCIDCRDKFVVSSVMYGDIRYCPECSRKRCGMCGVICTECASKESLSILTPWFIPLFRDGTLVPEELKCEEKEDCTLCNPYYAYQRYICPQCIKY